jgi:hypothetical protein
MIQYAWKSSGYLHHNIEFKNIREVCFESGSNDCDENNCGESFFIRCSICDKNLCLSHFFITITNIMNNYEFMS